MAHTHEHDTDTYYLDQLCLIALSGAFGAVCLTLYFWRVDMLNLVLAPQFHNFVLWSGIALLVLVVVRAITLWNAVGKAAHAEAHAHAHAPQHDHAHAHSHAHAGHTHTHDHCEGHEHEACAHDHDHAHAEPQGHDHAHEHGDEHDHGWAPWRYVILLLPILLYLLGLPSRGPSVGSEGDSPIDVTQEARSWAAVVSVPPDSLQQLALAAAASGDNHDGGRGEVVVLDFKSLETAANNPGTRDYWEGKRVTVKGQFAPHPSSNRHFALVRFRIQCCGADAISLKVPMVCKESLTGIPSGEWVTVTGRVAFQRKGPDSFFTTMQIGRRQDVVKGDPDPNPYIQ